MIRIKLTRLRYFIRKQPWVAIFVYMTGNLWHALVHSRQDRQKLSFIYTEAIPENRVALCLRFRDEAPYLQEWIEYYIAAGVDHFFLYNNYSKDSFASILKPYIDAGKVTLIEWPYSPASPAAEHDCIARALPDFCWVGFLDADEFVVIRDGRSIPDYLDSFGNVPGVALHWYYFGSNGHRRRPDDWVIRAYTRRAENVNQHFKVFVRPEQVTRNRNSHNFYYRNARCAVREDDRRVFGSMASPGIANSAWINHYFVKSRQDYLEKAARRSSLDRSGMREPSRRQSLVDQEMEKANDVVDLSALNYYNCRAAILLGLKQGAECKV